MKNVVICIDLNQDCFSTTKTLTSNMDLRGWRVHFIHIHENPVYNASLAPWVILSAEQDKIIEKSVVKNLTTLSREMDLSPNNVIVKCLFSQARDMEIKKYLMHANADLVVVATRGKHGIEGFFSSSLTDFLCKYSPCSVLVLRPQKK